MTKYFCILTDVGAAKLANATALGQALEFSEMALGDGGGSLPTPSQSQASLINEVRRKPLNSVEIDENNPNWIVCEQVLPANVGGWTIREMSIYDADGDMVAVGNFPETYKPVLEEGSGRTQTIRMVIQVSNAATVTLKIDPAVVLATREYVDKEDKAHADATDPHPQYQTKVAAAEAVNAAGSETNQLKTALESASAMINTLKLQLSGNFTKMIVSEPIFQMDAGSLKVAADLGVSVSDDFYSFSEGSALLLPGSMAIGTDYAIYATPDGLVVSANFTIPDGYTALTSRRVGGFHYQNGEINEYSLYDIKYRSAARNPLTGAIDPRGSARVPGVGWVDIYYLNTTPDLLGTSAFGAQIADGASPPKKPQYWGGDGIVQYADFSQYTASRVLAAYGKRLPTTHEHEQLAFGTVTGAKVGSDPGTIQYHAPTTSKFGIVGASGVMWQWALERWDRGNGASGYSWISGTDGEGQRHMAGSEGIGAAFVGSDWAGPEPGPRTSIWSSEPSSSNSNVAARGRSDHFESC